MLEELLQERSALYVAGALTPPEREQFELLLELHQEVGAFAAGMAETAAALTLGSLPPCGLKPCDRIRQRILDAVQARSQENRAGLVMTCPGGFVKWINPAFTKMCGYSLEEVRGKKLGPILQGKSTDRAVAERMRLAVHEHRPCLETLINYHKSGAPYWVEIAITPILDDAGHALMLVARERELGMPAAA